MRPTARELGITVGVGRPGPNNAITDVDGVRVGHCTLIEGDGALRIGEGPVRTGVTVVVPGERPWQHPFFAGAHRLNGNGEMTGLEWIRESGQLHSPIAITNTHSVGVVRDALVADEVSQRGAGGGEYWCLPVVAETWDGVLNDLNGFHVRAEHVAQALGDAASGPVAQGAVGGGTGMICHGFKGGTGTASRALDGELAGYTVGVLVQANHGRRERLTVNGVPVGGMFDEVPQPGAGVQGAGSIIVIVATDVPLLPHQCERVAKRASLGIARTGGVGENTSGDLLLCFSTANRTLVGGPLDAQLPLKVPVEMLLNSAITPLFDAVVEATEEAIVNALCCADTLTGRDGITAYELPSRRLCELLEGR